MAVPFYSDESETLNRKLSEGDMPVYDGLMHSSINLELDRCCEWIISHGFSKVALQFPDSLLSAAAGIAEEIAERTQKQFFILADTSYGRYEYITLITYSCCVDEIAAEHVKADAIIHFGHACLSVTQRLPVLYIFGKSFIDVPNVILSFKKTFPDKTSHVIIYYEVFYYHAIGEIAENLKEYENLVISELVIPNEECKAMLDENQVKIVKNQRYFIIPKTKDLKDYIIFYVGCRSETFTNVMLTLNKCRFYIYNTLEQSIGNDKFSFNHFLRKRFYYIERTRDAKIIGILVGTLGVSNYICTIKRLREAIAAARKKSYVIVIGKVNVAKLANFAEIEIFVNVACLESTIVDCSGFYQPIITPYELEIALNIRDWTDDYITDFAELLPDGAHHVPISEIKHKTDVSLITGKTRSIGLSDDTSDASDESKNESSSLVQRDVMAISQMHLEAAGEFLSKRGWKGLEQNLGETPVANIQQGRKGIAAEYEDENGAKD